MFEAVDALQRFEDVGVEFVEQPIDMHNIAGLADLRAKSRVRIGANQSAWLPHQVPEVIAQHAADVIVTDPHQLGGLVPFHNAATMCETAGLPICKHAFADLGVTTIATSHVLATLPSPQLGHQQFLTFLVHDLIAEKIEFVDGAIPVPTGPGLGIELDRDALAFYGDIYKQYGEFEGYAGHPRVAAAAGPAGPKPLMQTFEPTDLKYTYSPEHEPIGTVAPGREVRGHHERLLHRPLRRPGELQRRDGRLGRRASQRRHRPDRGRGRRARRGRRSRDRVGCRSTRPGHVVVSRCEALSPADWWHEEDHVVNLAVDDESDRARRWLGGAGRAADRLPRDRAGARDGPEPPRGRLPRQRRLPGDHRLGRP